MAVELFRADAPPGRKTLVGGSIRYRAIVAAPPEGWIGPAVGEWWLEDAEYTDCHPFDEINIVLDGTLTVECAGRHVIAHAGDAVRVPAGSTATYRAEGSPTHMIYIYGANPHGLRSFVLGDGS